MRMGLEQIVWAKGISKHFEQNWEIKFATYSE
jgi:hypothetical protein